MITLYNHLWAMKMAPPAKVVLILVCVYGKGDDKLIK